MQRIMTRTLFIPGAFRGSLAFIGAQCFIPLKNSIGLATTFWSFSTITVMVMAFTLLFLPETKGANHISCSDI